MAPIRESVVTDRTLKASLDQIDGMNAALSEILMLFDLLGCSDDNGVSEKRKRQLSEFCVAEIINRVHDASTLWQAIQHQDQIQASAPDQSGRVIPLDVTRGDTP